mmetsp:Transcript_2339/g.2508  ORF Transcript_2339/g.2508 Transcript_2339/m.2508 type:complete len:494 (-) Transcript_2339:126-1607(-)
MLLKTTQSVAKSCFQVPKRTFVRGALLDYFKHHDQKDANYQVASFNPATPLEGHKGIVRAGGERKTKVTKLKNGITVVTEVGAFPGVVDLGILLDVGVRDETKETSGALLSIKNTYLKTVLTTNETVNYGIVQMSGGDFTMDYDQENTYFKAHCLGHDVTDVFSMISDCALEPKSAVAADVGIWKNHETHKLEDYLQTGEDFHDQVMQVAYGGKGLGMPLTGHRHNVNYLNAHTIQKFQMENINPSRIFVAAAGLEDHDEFVNLVEEKLGFLQQSKGGKQRDASKYLGGEYRNAVEGNHLNIVLAFESVNWKHSDVITFNVISALLGNSSVEAHTLGKGLNARLRKNLAEKNAYIDYAHALNFHFSDSGLFGIHAQGSASNGKEILNSLTTELKNLTKPIPADELQRAKNVLKANIAATLERQTDRIEEAVKNVKLFGGVYTDKYFSEVDKVTSEQINKAVADLLTKNPTFAVRGGDAYSLPSLDKIQNSLKL